MSENNTPATHHHTPMPSNVPALDAKLFGHKDTESEEDFSTYYNV